MSMSERSYVIGAGFSANQFTDPHPPRPAPQPVPPTFGVIDEMFSRARAADRAANAPVDVQAQEAARRRRHEFLAHSETVAHVTMIEATLRNLHPLKGSADEMLVQNLLSVIAAYTGAQVPQAERLDVTATGATS